MRKQPSRVNPIDMTLRLWSDEFLLEPYVVDLNLTANHLHIKGLPMAKEGYLAGRPAKSHYASIAQEEGKDGTDISNWLRRASALVGSHDELVGLLQDGKVEALFWIAILGGKHLPTPPLDPDAVSLVATLNSKILIENYTDDSPDLPTKVWFPAA